MTSRACVKGAAVVVLVFMLTAVAIWISQESQTAPASNTTPIEGPSFVVWDWIGEKSWRCSTEEDVAQSFKEMADQFVIDLSTERIAGPKPRACLSHPMEYLLESTGPALEEPCYCREKLGLEILHWDVWKTDSLVATYEGCITVRGTMYRTGKCATREEATTAPFATETDQGKDGIYFEIRPSTQDWNEGELEWTPTLDLARNAPVR